MKHSDLSKEQEGDGSQLILIWSLMASCQMLGLLSLYGFSGCLRSLPQTGTARFNEASMSLNLPKIQERTTANFLRILGEAYGSAYGLRQVTPPNPASRPGTFYSSAFA